MIMRICEMCKGTGRLYPDCEESRIPCLQCEGAGLVDPVNLEMSDSIDPDATETDDAKFRSVNFPEY